MFGLTSNSIIAILIALVIGAGAGWKWRDYQASEDALAAANQQLEALKTGLVERDKISAEDAAKSKTLEDVLTAMREEKPQVIIQREKEYVKMPVYRDCVLPDSGVQLLNERISARNKRAADTGKR